MNPRGPVMSYQHPHCTGASSVSARILASLLTLTVCAPLHGAQLELGDCELSAQERSFVEALATHPGQRRSELICDPVLVGFAAARAADMADRGYFGHVDPDNAGPNRRLRESGYPLPEHYRGGRTNNVESLLGGIGDPGRAVAELADSRDHRPHLLGEDPFYAEQDRFGIAYLRDPDTPQVDIWVLIIARPERPDDPRLYCTPAPGRWLSVGREGQYLSSAEPQVKPPPKASSSRV